MQKRHDSKKRPPYQQPGWTGVSGQNACVCHTHAARSKAVTCGAPVHKKKWRKNKKGKR